MMRTAKDQSSQCVRTARFGPQIAYRLNDGLHCVEFLRSSQLNGVMASLVYIVARTTKTLIITLTRIFRICI